MQPSPTRPTGRHPSLLRSAVAAGLGGLVGTLLLACASQPPPPTHPIAMAQAAYESASRAGAATLAPAEMALARDKLARANTSMVETQYERAQMLAEAALVDARLAEAKARQSNAAKAATTAQEGNRVLREELQRGAAQ